MHIVSNLIARRRRTKIRENFQLDEHIQISAIRIIRGGLLPYFVQTENRLYTKFREQKQRRIRES
jgi:hypothetical protein